MPSKSEKFDLYTFVAGAALEAAKPFPLECNCGGVVTVGDGRYVVMPQGWASSFGEMYAAIANRTIEHLYAVAGATVLMLSGGLVLRFTEGEIRYGQTGLQSEPARVATCWKNIELEPCTLDFIKSLTIGKSITSAGDFGNYLEVGVDRRFNLGLHKGGFHLISTQNPVAEHRL